MRDCGLGAHGAAQRYLRLGCHLERPPSCRGCSLLAARQPQPRAGGRSLHGGADPGEGSGAAKGSGRFYPELREVLQGDQHAEGVKLELSEGDRQQRSLLTPTQAMGSPEGTFWGRRGGGGRAPPG